MGQGTLTLQEAVDALKLPVTLKDARKDIADGLLVTSSHSDEVVWIGDWVRWMRYRTAREGFPPEKRAEFRTAMIEAMSRLPGGQER